MDHVVLCVMNRTKGTSQRMSRNSPLESLQVSQRVLKQLRFLARKRDLFAVTELERQNRFCARNDSHSASWCQVFARKHAI